MLTLGITGGVGMGKSSAAGFLAARGVRIVDSDDLAREAVAPGQPALAEIEAAFGAKALGADGSLDRAAMARIVFAGNDDAARRKLEAIVHPRIAQRWQAQLDEWRDRGTAIAGVVIPLLFEVGAAAAFDCVICVACGESTQRTRLSQRGWTEAQSQGRIAAQWPVERKMELAAKVVWTEGSLNVHSRQWDLILRSLRSWK